MTNHITDTFPEVVLSALGINVHHIITTVVQIVVDSRQVVDEIVAVRCTRVTHQLSTLCDNVLDSSPQILETANSIRLVRHSSEVPRVVHLLVDSSKDTVLLHHIEVVGVVVIVCIRCRSISIIPRSTHRPFVGLHKHTLQPHILPRYCTTVAEC